MNVAWACILTIVLVRSLALRHPCPSYCIADVRPLFDDTCQCAYANINCVALNATDPTEFLHPEDVGTHMFYLQISRCDLRTGLSQMSLTPFVNLNKLMLVYSNMESWEGPMPPSVGSVMIRYSRLRSIPHALQLNLPSNFIILFLESSPISVIPDTVVAAWANLER
ncbi:hypothetical protein As57867_007572, partial [Aphanomyces stellatus]